ncbi:MAG: PilZ domain-containing protein [Spirochaetaceae bacterium]|nr:PilZ domain-containing protein [Spirochaetaceae bacterium]
MNVFWGFLILLAVSAAFIVVLFRFDTGEEQNKKKNGALQFYVKGKDLGFSFQEIELLRRLAVKSDIEDPSALFWSQTQLDACIRSLVRSVRHSGTGEDPAIQEFLSKLYDYRKKIEFEHPPVKKGLISSRQIGESQSLRILITGIGVFQSRLIKNTSRYITIARPSGPIPPKKFSWTGQRLAVYFWRYDDAGYVFDTDVLDEVYSKGYPALQISHPDALFRTQKRKSIRMKIHTAALLYLQERESPDAAQNDQGLKCLVNDISDSGCAVTIGGKGSEGLQVKVQFILNTTSLTLPGVVCSVDYNSNTNRSILHIKADSLPRDTRNAILGEIFGMQDDEEALPVRITEETEQTDDLGSWRPDEDPVFAVPVQDAPKDVDGI